MTPGSAVRRNIPSLTALQAFESAARFLSFTKAAAELKVTQSAVSRLIRSLEDQLGVDLFHRSKSGVSLTAAGLEYLPAIGKCLDEVEAATAGIRGERQADGVLHLGTLPTFGSRWLVPRLPEFERRHPEIHIRLSVRTEPIDFGGPGLDAAIFFGAPVKSSLVYERLIGDELVPVCSPGLIAPGKVFDPLAHPLLELSNPGSWRRLLKSAGLSRDGSESAVTFDYFSVGIQAAVSGQGILLAPGFLVVDELLEGRLVVPIDARVKTDSAYYLVYPDSKRRLPALRKFQAWIKTAVAEAQRDCERCLEQQRPLARVRSAATEVSR